MASTPAIVKELLEQLITATTQITEKEDPTNFELCRSYALHGIKHHNFGRTNHFEVGEKLDGLEEKFRVYNKDDIADALRSRLDELERVNFKWKAEVLSLILNLSVHPVKFSNVKALRALAPEKLEKTLTWDDILGDEPLEGGDIWDGPDYGADTDLSSDEDGPRQFESIGAPESEESATEVDEDEKIIPVECFATPVDWAHLKRIKAVQYWHVREHCIGEEVDTSLSQSQVDKLWIISELNAVREILFMLNGYPSSLFEVGKRTLGAGKDTAVVWIDTSKAKRQFALRHSSVEVFMSVLGWFAERGTAINRIREFIAKKEDVPAKQSFIAALVGSLNKLNRTLGQLQSHFAENRQVKVVSILGLQRDLEAELGPYMSLASIVQTLSNLEFNTSSAYSSEHLNLLFETTCSLQSIGDLRGFEFMAIIFFQCLQTYLRPIREWMESGELRSGDTSFFISKSRNHNGVDLGSLWHDQYTTLKDGSGKLKIPIFMIPFANRIFTTGKTVVFLKHLIDYDTPPVPSPTHKDDLNFHTLYPQGIHDDDNGLAPFDELFTSAFEVWIQEKHHSVSGILRNVLYRDCGLWNHLCAIDHIYLCRDGYQLSSVATVVFDKIDRGRMNLWNDRFLLTELIQSVYSTVKFIDTRRLGVRRVTSGVSHRALSNGNYRSVNILGGIAIEYSLPWPILNIIQAESFETYKAVFTFLLQLRRAKYVIERLRTTKQDFREILTYEEGSMHYNLRHRMLWFVNLINEYVTNLAIFPLTEKMGRDMEKAVDMDGMIKVHQKYVKELKERCLLGTKLKSVHESIIKLLDLAVLFSDAYVKMTEDTGIGLGHGGTQIGISGVTTPVVDLSRSMVRNIVENRVRRKRKRRRGRHDEGDTSSDEEEHQLQEDHNPHGSPSREVLVPMSRQASAEPSRQSSLDPESPFTLDSRPGSPASDSASERGFESVYSKKLHRAGKRFMKEKDFIKRTLRGVARAGVAPHLDLLADMLEAGYVERGLRIIAVDVDMDADMM